MLLDLLTAEHSPPPRLPSPVNNDYKNGAYSLVQIPFNILGSVLRYQTSSPTPNSQQDIDTDHVTNPVPSSYTPATHVDSPAPSRPGSSSSSAVADEKRRKRPHRPKTSFIIALPPPTDHHRSKLHIRPKVQLQLHQVLTSQRPKPVYEVISFSLLGPRSHRHLARTFNTRERLCLHDLLIVKSAAYSQADEDHQSDDERWGSREVIAVICPAKTDKGQVVSHTEICMADGTSRWEVTPMPNGGFEFNTLDEHGLAKRARWVAKPAVSRRISGLSATSQLSPGLPPTKDDARWNFSTISSKSRRHPVIATMNRTRIDVNDSYFMPAATQPSTPDAHFPTSPALTLASINANSFVDSIDRAPIQTEESLQRFIVVSGIWVSALHESHEQSGLPLCAIFNTSGNFRPSMSRAASMSFLDSPRSASPASNDENEKSIPKLLRSNTQRLARNASFHDSPASPKSATLTLCSPAQKTRSRRSNSTGTHSLYNSTGSLKKRFGIPFGVETLSETEEDRENKRSEEILRLKNQAVPTTIETPSEKQKKAAAPPHRPSVLVIPTPTVISPSTDGSTSPMLLPSPALPDSDRTRKAQSAFNPITTAGMWDSGVTEGPGIQKRPTSMFVMNERKRKEEKKRGRSEGRPSIRQERPTLNRRSTSEEDLKGFREIVCTGMRQKLKKRVKGIFGKKGKV